MLFYGFWYNPMGEFAKWRALAGHDYTSVVKTRWDDSIPVVVPFIIPYFLVYMQPLVYVAIAVRTKGLRASLPILRRFHFTQFFLMSTAYVCYVLFPVSIASIMYPRPVDSAPFLARYTWTLIKNGMSDYCACPSMHVAHVLSMSLVHQSDGLPGRYVASCFAILTCLSTVFTRAHYINDVPAGILLAFFVDRFVFRPMKGSRGYFYDRTDLGVSSNARRVAIAAAVPAAVLLGSEILVYFTNARVDMIGMLAGTVSKAPGIV